MLTKLRDGASGSITECYRSLLVVVWLMAGGF